MISQTEKTDAELLEMLRNDKIDAFTEEISKDYSQQMNSEIAMYKEILGEDFSFSDEEEPDESDSNNRTHTISFRVTDEELAKIDKRFEKSGFSNRGEFLRFTALNAFIFKENKKQIKQIANDISGVSRNINQIAMRVNRNNSIYKEDLQELKKGIQSIWQSLTSVQSTRTLYNQLNTSLTLQKPMTAFWLLLIYVYLNHMKQPSSLKQSVRELAEEKLQLKLNI